jgi:hypothetical protein
LKETWGSANQTIMLGMKNEVGAEIDRNNGIDFDKTREIRNALLLGLEGSGKTTFALQAAALNGDGFAEKDLNKYTSVIHSNANSLRANESIQELARIQG